MIRLLTEILSFDLVIIGSGIAGLRAALEASMTVPRLRIAVITKVQAMRSHSVSAEGGTAAVLRIDEGDSFESHFKDTIIGSDFLADQDAVKRFVEAVPREILQLDNWGMPWNRRKDGKIAQRPFGGHEFHRTAFAADRVGFFEMQTLYDTVQNFDNIEIFHEWYVTSLCVENGVYKGIITLDLKNGELIGFKSKACIMATGGAGRLYGFTTYSHSSTADGLALAYNVGLPLQDMEFIQFHPTGLVPTGILVSEAARAEGGVLLNKNGERFMNKYAPSSLELAPRDIVSQAIIKEIEHGQGYRGPDRKDYVLLDVTELGEDRINERIPQIRELAINTIGVDPIDEPLPVRPVAHFVMGGISTSIEGQTQVKGLWAAGECACVSIHGANRLGTNSTAECLVYGKIVGQKASKFIENSVSSDFPLKRLAAEEIRIFDNLLGGTSSINPYEIKKEFEGIMDKDAYVFRSGETLMNAFKKVKSLSDSSFRHVEDRSRVYNTNLVNVMEIDATLQVGQILLLSAYARTESRGAHFRIDFPRRDDNDWLKHTLAYKGKDGPELSYTPVRITTIEPKERKY
jgi:succinate dehydrogenase / fumarate reductase flavoprotein subunit